MISSDEKLAAISDYLKRFYEILNKSPLMLGKMSELNTILFYIDHLTYIAKYGEDFPHELSWIPFLGEIGYLRGDYDLLAESVEGTSNLNLFYEMRAEYARWFLSKTGRDLTIEISTSS
jgi:hypothetical protein